MGQFSEFYEENFSLVLGVAQRRLSSPEDAEDVVNDAFEIAWNHFTRGGELSVPWLYVVVRNLVGTTYRRRNRRAALQQRLTGEFMGTARLATSDFDDVYSEVREAIAALPSEFREVLEMTYWDELTAPEIAEVLEMSPAAVRKRLSRARQQLRDELAIPEEEKSMRCTDE